MRQSRQKTVEQSRAAEAWTNIQEVEKTGFKNAYGTLARRLPAMIQINGLGSTIAFLLSKAKGTSNNAHALMVKHLSAHIDSFLEFKDGKTLMDWIRERDTPTYRRMTAEVIAYGIWLKRYVEAQDWGSAEESEA